MLLNHFSNQKIVLYLKIFAFILLFILLMIILIGVCIGKAGEVIQLVGALAILVSALLAVYSVMLNIENTNRNEKEKKEDENRSNIHFLIQNLIDITSVSKTYDDKDIGDLKINNINKIKYILSKKLDNIEDKQIFQYLTDDELNHLLVLRLRLYENVSILDNYSQGIVIDNPSMFNKNMKDISYIGQTILELLSKNHGIPMQKVEN